MQEIVEWFNSKKAEAMRTECSFTKFCIRRRIQVKQIEKEMRWGEVSFEGKKVDVFLGQGKEANDD